MTKTYDDVVSDVMRKFDGDQRNFTRLNRPLSCCLTSISPGSSCKVAIAMISACLCRVHKWGGKDGAEDPLVGGPDHGRWSEPFTAQSLKDMALADMDVSRINRALRSLYRERLFYAFSIRLGRKGLSTIGTYNRYVQTCSLFWPNRLKAGKDFSPPVVPRMIARASVAHSYHNAVKRQYDAIKIKMAGCDGWKTDDEINARIREAFCGFLWEMILGACPEVRARFSPYDGSRSSPEEYVMGVHEVASKMPAYEGIPMTREFLSGLYLPKDIIDELISKMDQHDEDSVGDDGPTAEVQEDIFAFQTVGDGEIGKDETSSQSEVQEDKTACQTGVRQDKTSYQNDGNFVRKRLAQKVLVEDESDGHRINTDTKFEDIPPTERQETAMREETEPEVAQVVMETGSSEGEYNGDMSDPTGEHEHGLPVELYAREEPVRKVQPKRPREDDEMEALRDASMRHDSNQKRREKEASETILNSVAKLVREFHGIVKEMIPSARFSEKAHMDDHLCAKIATDELRKSGVLDEGVLRSWMRHTVESNRGMTYFKVRLMLSSLRSFERHLPPPESVAGRRPKAKPTAKRNPVEAAMERTFSGGVSDMNVAYVCQFWGAQITAAYLSRTLGKDEARRVVVAAIRAASGPDAKGALSVTEAHEEVAKGLPLGDWRDALSDVLARVGRLERFSATPNEQAAAREFATAARRLQ